MRTRVLCGQLLPCLIQGSQSTPLANMHVSESCTASHWPQGLEKKRHNSSRVPLLLFSFQRLIIFKIARLFKHVWLLARNDTVVPAMRLHPRPQQITQEPSTSQLSDTACYNHSWCKREGTVPLRRHLSQPLKVCKLTPAGIACAQNGEGWRCLLETKLATRY